MPAVTLRTNVIFPPHTLSKYHVLDMQIEFLDTLVQGGWRPHAPGWRARSGGTQDRGGVVRELHTQEVVCSVVAILEPTYSREHTA
jgi:hypothetical protein